MLLKLAGRALTPLSSGSAERFIARITEQPALPEAARTTEILLTDAEYLPPGFRAYLVRQPRLGDCPPATFALSPEFHYLRDGDIVRIDPVRRTVTTLYRRGSRSNSFLVTERCDNFCLMCSQPPKDRDDSWLADELEQVIPLIDQDAREIGLTGGEPSLLGERLVALVDQLRRFLPNTAVHILSNGRGFRSLPLAQALGRIKHPDLMVGIPLYSDVADEHDFIVQATGAFDDTVRGIMNLKRHGVRIEIRFVIHAHSHEALASFAAFVTRNLLFVDHVALMGLEQMGFGRSNLETLWIDPVDYQPALSDAVRTLHRAGLSVSIYNHQLCVLRPELRAFARASISDWKNVYLDECRRCELRSACGGFFASSTEHRSRAIAPFVNPLPTVSSMRS